MITNKEFEYLYNEFDGCFPAPTPATSTVLSKRRQALFQGKNQWPYFLRLFVSRATIRYLLLFYLTAPCAGLAAAVAVSAATAAGNRDPFVAIAAGVVALVGGLVAWGCVKVVMLV